MFAIDVPLPGMDAGTVKELKKLLDGYKQASEQGPIRGGVVSEGDAAAYSLVWEWGNARQTKEGPKTVKGINPDGEEVWLSVQAPFGYIRIHEEEFLRILQDNLSALDFSKTETGKQICNEIKKVSVTSAEMIAELLREAAPRDKGDLQDSIQAADPNDPDLAVEDEDIELGESNFGHAVRRSLRKLKG